MAETKNPKRMTKKSGHDHPEVENKTKRSSTIKNKKNPVSDTNKIHTESRKQTGGQNKSDNLGANPKTVTENNRNKTAAGKKVQNASANGSPTAKSTTSRKASPAKSSSTKASSSKKAGAVAEKKTKKSTTTARAKDAAKASIPAKKAASNKSTKSGATGKPDENGSVKSKSATSKTKTTAKKSISAKKPSTSGKPGTQEVSAEKANGRAKPTAKKSTPSSSKVDKHDSRLITTIEEVKENTPLKEAELITEKPKNKILGNKNKQQEQGINKQMKNFQNNVAKRSQILKGNERNPYKPGHPTNK